ncbi:MAG: hypothetical protein WDZ91_08025 [Paenibacillaceae bacterium]
MDNTLVTVCERCKAWLIYDKDIDELDIPKLCIGCRKIKDKEKV